MSKRCHLFAKLIILGLVAVATTACDSSDDNVDPPWELVWSDEFSGDSLSTSNWEYNIGDGCPDLCGWGNNELQYYQSPNVAVAGGSLVITAREESVGDAAYTSGRITTRQRADWLYGRFEIRARLPEGQGIWPAIWMLPTENAYGAWAASGELDIVELVGHEPSRVHTTIHHGGEWPENTSSTSSFSLPSGAFADEFHTFAMEWEEGELRWFVDDLLVYRLNRWTSAGGAFPAPFDRPFHLLINLAVGGNWPGSPDSSTVFPQQLEVDYVRVYQP